MGAIVGAAYAAGLSGADLRAHTLGIFRDRTNVMGRLLKARVGRFADLFAGRGVNPVLVDGEIVLDHFWPEAVPDRFEDLALPFSAVATNYLARCEAMFFERSARSRGRRFDGHSRPRQADRNEWPDLRRWRRRQSAALYSSLRPRRCGDRLRRDRRPGGDRACDPASFRSHARRGADHDGDDHRTDGAGAGPDILVRPPVDQFRALDFFRAAQILAAAEGAKDEIKRGLAVRLDKV